MKRTRSLAKAPRRAAITASADGVRGLVARDCGDEDVPLERVEDDVRHRGHGGRSRDVAQQRDLAERSPGPSVLPATSTSPSPIT